MYHFIIAAALDTHGRETGQFFSATVSSEHLDILSKRDDFHILESYWVSVMIGAAL